MSDIFEALTVSYIIDDDNSIGIAVIRVCYGTETLLSSCIPLLSPICTCLNIYLPEWLDSYQY